MPDSQIPRAQPPRDWAEAFGGLPAAPPPADGWARVVQALDAAPVHPAIRSPRRESPHRVPLWLAAAAVLAVVAALPLALIDDTPSPSTPAPMAVVTPAAGKVADRGSPASGEPFALQQQVPAAANAAAQLERPTDRALASTAPEPRARKPVAMPNTDVPAAHAPGTPASDTRAASTVHDVAVADVVVATAGTASGPDTIVDAPPDPLLQLQAESAQLEALVAFARDERVAAASSAVLASDLDTRIGQIDAELSQPDVTLAQRAALWQQRVVALRELAGVETTQRWLAARGERYDGALVRVD